MTDGTWVPVAPWLLVVILAAYAVGNAVRLRRARAAHAQESADRDAEHSRAIAQTHREMQSTLASVETKSTAAIAAARSREEAAATRAWEFQRYSARSLYWEAASRQRIIEASRKNGIDGVLATNISFIPLDGGTQDGSPIVAQIDHVLLTETRAILFESKYWRGAVFDCQLPGAVHPALRHLVDETALKAGPFAVRMSRSQQGADVLSLTKSNAPRVQARRQAARLGEYIRAQGIEAPWIETTVFYSHRDVEVFTSHERHTSADTRIVSTPKELTQAITAAKAPRTTQETPPLSIAPVLEATGAEMFGLGRHADRWKSPLPVDLGKLLHEKEQTRRPLMSAPTRDTT